MSELKRTQFYDVHVAAGGTMVDFGGWEMPIQYPEGIVAEHLYTRSHCSLFDVSHMGRILVEGPQRVEFLQYVLTSNVAKLEVNRAQYCIIPNANGGAIDDAYLNRFDESSILLVVNASNTEKDLKHLREEVKKFDCTLTDLTSTWGAIAIQGPETEKIMKTLSGGKEITEQKRNCVNTVLLEGRTALVAKTGYTGEPLGYEVYLKNEDLIPIWNRMCELGAKPAGLGARDTLRLEGTLPLYGHEMGCDPDGKEMPIFAVSLAKFAVSFAEEKGDFIGKEALKKQFDAFTRIGEKDYTAMDVLPKKVMSLCLTDRGVIRAGMPVYRGGQQIGWVTSGTMVPYFDMEGEDENVKQLETTGKRSIGFCYVSSDVCVGDTVEVDVRGRRLKARIVNRHLKLKSDLYAVPILCK